MPSLLPRVPRPPRLCIPTHPGRAQSIAPRQRPKWAYHLIGLKAGLEGGAATPYPEDMKISGWG